jgi:asparagine synthase (glutamine-hydrolysing)
MSWPDARIVLAAWEKFGNALWPTLRGPFAAAIFVPTTQTLTLARDHLGLNVVMWHKAERFFAFATMPKGLFALPEVPSELSLEKVADFIVLNHADHMTTMYRHIYRIAPAHVATVGADGSMSIARFWSTSDVRPIRMGTDQEYADGLRRALDTAVRRQLRSAHAIGCYLSGGLDSSAVTALAAKAFAEKGQRLATYTQVPRKGFSGPPPRGRYNDETPYVKAIADKLGNIDLNFLHNDECDDFADLERFFLVFEQPVRNPPNLGWMLAIPRMARAQGRRVLLGGVFGNYTISWSGWSQAIGHLLRGRMLTAYRQWSLYYRRSSNSRLTVFRKLFLDPIMPRQLGLWAHRIRTGQPTAWIEHAAIRPSFAAEMQVDARARTNGHDFRYQFGRNERVFGLQNVDYLGDWFAAQKAFAGVEYRDPTADIDVVEYCFGVPPEQFLAEGIDRSLIRRAMWNDLPPLVVTNRLGGMQSADWYEKLDRQREERAADVAELARSPLARRVIDLERLNRAMQTWPDEGWNARSVYNEYCLALTRGIAAGRFLKWMESTNRATGCG